MTNQEDTTASDTPDTSSDTLAEAQSGSSEAFSGNSDKGTGDSSTSAEKLQTEVEEDADTLHAAGKVSDSAPAGNAHPHRRRNIAIIAVAVVVVLVAAVLVGFGTGYLIPGYAAARYGAFKYIAEQDVTDYIETYKEQMGYGEANDDAWAEFLATYNLDPERLRFSTITQLLMDIETKDKCAELGITASDEELDDIIQTMKDTYAYGGDDTWNATLETYGQTEEGVREVYKLDLLKQKLCIQEVPTPVPTDDEVRDYLKTYAQSAQYTALSNADTEEEANEISSDAGKDTIKHSYCFSYKAAGDEISLSESSQVELIRSEFIQSGLDVETFITVLAMYSNDEDCIEISGDMGWDADTSEYSLSYANTLSSTDVGTVSNVMSSGDTCYFIWVDQGYDLPYSEEAINVLDLGEIPSSLYEYFSDCEAYMLWQEDSQEYLENLVFSLPVTIYPMPGDVPYNVDMSDYVISDDDETADTADAEDEASDVGADASTDADAATSTDAGFASIVQKDNTSEDEETG